MVVGKLPMGIICPALTAAAAEKWVNAELRIRMVRLLSASQPTAIMRCLRVA